MEIAGSWQLKERRVGATAWSRQIGGNWQRFPQFATEMAAPLETRTPTGTAAKIAANECVWKHGDKAQETASEQESSDG